MTLKQFLEENNVTGFQIIPDTVIINTITDDNTTHAIDVDTSNILSGTQLVNENIFEVVGDILTVSTLTLNILTTMMMSNLDEPIPIENV
jgi:hypothetical protein